MFQKTHICPDCNTIYYNNYIPENNKCEKCGSLLIEEKEIQRAKLELEKANIKISREEIIETLSKKHNKGS